jgi:hypothetical protein
MSPQTEHEDLNLHVSICHQRYLTLDQRISSVEMELKEIKASVRNIDQQLGVMVLAQHDKWGQAKSALIGVLVATVAFLLSHTLF